MLLSVLLALQPKDVLAEWEGLQRQVHRFDFEEAAKGNFESLPMHWWVIGRDPKSSQPSFLRQPLHQTLTRLPGYPSYGVVQFDRPPAEAGNHSLMLKLNGGNVGAFVEVGTLPAVPGSDYLLTAKVRTRELNKAFARLSVYFVDAMGQRIESSVRSVDIRQNTKDWQDVTLQLLGHEPRAAWMGLEVHLLQPEADPAGDAQPHQLKLQDIRGQAYFDDIVLWQIPRVLLKTQSPVNIIRSPDKPTLSVDVRDLHIGQLAVEIALYDHRLQQIDRQRWSIGRHEMSTWRWSPSLPRFGWYLADLTVRDASTTSGPGADGSITRVLRAFLYLPDDSPLSLAQSRRFGLDLQGQSMGELRDLPAVLRSTGLNLAVVSAWDKDTTAQNIEPRIADLGSVMRQMIDAQTLWTLSLSPLPSSVADKLPQPSRGAIAGFEHAAPDLRALLTPVLRQFGHGVHHWQLGDPRAGDAFASQSLPTLIASVHKDLESLAPRPRVLVPWLATHQRTANIPAGATYAVHVPAAIAPANFADYLADFRTKPALPLFLSLDVEDALTLTHEQRAISLALRLLHAWALEPEAVILRKPWTAELDAMHKRMLLPDPLLGVYSSMARRLADRKLVGTLKPAEGVQALVYDGPQGGMLAIWNVSAASAAEDVELDLGPSPRALDIWGNPVPLRVVRGRHILAATASPTFIEGIDPNLALFRAAFRVEPAFVESKQVEHESELVLSNPWPVTLTASVNIVEPAKWQITPRFHSVSIPAGQTVKLPVRMLLPVSELAGPKTLVAKVDLVTEQEQKVTVSSPLEVGLPQIKFDANLGFENDPAGGARHVVITETVTNLGNQPLSMFAFAAIKGHPSQERIITALQPGQTVVRRFRFLNAADTVRQSAARVGLRETTGPAILNQNIGIEP